MFIGNNLHAKTLDEESKLRSVENWIMNTCQKFPEIMKGVCGNIYGVIFLFRFPKLFVDKSRHLEFSIDNLVK